MVKSKGKRPAQGQQGPSKKRKLSTSRSSKPKDAPKTAKSKGKERASDKPIIPIPTYPANDDGGEDLSDDDMEAFNDFGHAAAFLHRLDEKGIARSKKETIRLHKLNKPTRASVKDDLPSIDSHSEDEGSWSSGIEDSDVSSESSSKDRGPLMPDSDAEMPYESLPRRHHTSQDSEKELGVESLPIKLLNGQIQKTGVKFRHDTDESESEEDIREQEDDTYKVEDISTGARFGRRSVVDVITIKSRKARIHNAKEQIASVCQEIVSDPENSLGLLRRLHTFCLPEVSSPSRPQPVMNDVIIRKLSILSQLAVFKDIIPGYRIRTLTEIEKSEKVSQVVARTREWEQGLVGIYQQYLRILESELRAKSDLADTSLQCMCVLLAEVTHFNFRTNLIGCIIAKLSRKSWNKSSDLCLNTLITVLREDATGVPSLEVVRLINRMIKEKKYDVNPEVLSCLLHLRLKTELGVRASETRVDQEVKPKSRSDNKSAARRAKGKPTDKPHLSNKAKKVLKERKEVQKEMREAEIDIDKEDRNNTHTETLKLVFVLYFSVLKNPRPSPLLPAALRGISKFAHLVNIDFFRDLLKVLKDIMPLESITTDDEISTQNVPQPIYLCLLCISTAFDLLSGQGEALNIDLSDFINHLYAIIPLLCASPVIELSPMKRRVDPAAASHPQSSSDLLFRALHLVFSPRASASVSPVWRSAAFAKRLLTAALHWPPSTAIRAIEFVGRLIVRDNKLQALLSTEDRSVDGIYRPDLDDPQLSQPFGTSFWELRLLAQNHYDKHVREAARKLCTPPAKSNIF